MLPPDALFEAVLEDISRADAPAAVLGRTRLDPAGQPPFRFEIAYHDAAVRPGGRHAVRATIRHDGRLPFRCAKGARAPRAVGSAAAPAPAGVLRQLSFAEPEEEPRLSRLPAHSHSIVFCKQNTFKLNMLRIHSSSMP